jgi:hypothetical protein
VTSRSGADHAAERLQVAGQRVADALRSAARKGPASGVRGEREDQADGGTGTRFERQRGVGGQPGKQGAGARAAEMGLRHGARGTDGVETELRHFERMARQVRRRQYVVAQARPGFGQRPHQAPPRFAIGAQAGGGGVD